MQLHLTFPDDSKQEIPYGYCQCGCGRKTNLIRQTAVKLGLVKGEPRRFLSGHDKRRPLAERFWQYLTLSPVDQCWEWQGACDSYGYGILHTIGSDRPMEKAHRVSWRLHFGPIREGLLVCHTCDNPPCCNPHHLFLGTKADNNADKIAKGRQAYPPWTKGEAHARHKLSEAQVIDIRARYSPGKVTMLELAREHGVAQMTISDIIRRRTWTHI